MKKLTKLLRGHKHILFMDFEGTQYSHEMIAYGAILVSIDPATGRIKKRKQPIKRYVLAKNPIGNYVVDLTKITEAQLRKEGVPFAQALKDLKKYCGMNFKKCTFVTFGNHDLRILNQSIAHTFNYPKDITSQIQKNYFDFGAFISEFVRDEKGNPLSLVHNCELFKVQQAGQAHDPSVDAINLANLYDAFVENKDLVIAEYKKTMLQNHNHLPEPIKNVLQKLINNKQVSIEDLETEIRKYIA
ncbi:MAG: exonuclease domain-containing protein [Bacilli bacterium]|nr:exonuclease domain-containing protein [Bacilli bacterium]